MKQLSALILAVLLALPWSISHNSAPPTQVASSAQVVHTKVVKKVVRKAAPYSASRSRSYAHKRMSQAQFKCLDNIWTRESNWNHKSANKHSSAYGIPQMLHMKETNPYKQIDIGLKYIEERYGTPCKAWEFWQIHYWY